MDIDKYTSIDFKQIEEMKEVELSFDEAFIKKLYHAVCSILTFRL